MDEQQISREEFWDSYNLAEYVLDNLARMDRLYAIPREGWLNQRHKYEVDPKTVLKFVYDRLKGLEKTIDELGRENATAETKFRDFNPEREPEAHRPKFLRILREDLTLDRPSSSKVVAELKEILNAQRSELKRLREALQAMDIQNKDAVDLSEIVVIVEATDKAKRSVLRSERKLTVWEEEEAQDDDTYFERMMEEVEGEEKAIPEEQGAQVQLAGQLEEMMAERRQEAAQVSPNAANQRAEMIQIHNARVSELRRAVQESNDILRNFPFRNIGEFSRGVDCNVKCAFCGDIGRRYSDSCPLVIESEYRYNIVRTHGICPHCLGGCLPGRCKFPPRECVLRKTSRDMDGRPHPQRRSPSCAVPSTRCKGRSAGATEPNDRGAGSRTRGTGPFAIKRVINGGRSVDYVDQIDLFFVKLNR
ncbi:unnamed protein product [Heligmosomoides polygyrus]|uniref:CCHC-type domain-containing protein n=1 Tax=Heligmosomoides polygyrus TaxID=6339 RepID=A0A183FWR7_HELPZ|nr:unnamed protein product [Heligmosomoides polygyrus]